MFSKVPWRLGIINSTLTFAKLYPQLHEIPREQANRPSQSKQMLHFGCCITWTATLLVWSTNPHESRVGTALGAHTGLLNQTRTCESTAQGLSCSTRHLSSQNAERLLPQGRGQPGRLAISLDAGPARQSTGRVTAVWPPDLVRFDVFRCRSFT